MEWFLCFPFQIVHFLCIKMQLILLSLYPATLLNSLINSNSFVLKSSVFYIYNYIICKQIIFLPFQLGCLISFSYLTALARTSRTIMNRNGESGRPYHVPDLRRKAFIQSLTIMMFALGFSYVAFIV